MSKRLRSRPEREIRATSRPERSSCCRTSAAKRNSLSCWPALMAAGRSQNCTLAACALPKQAPQASAAAATAVRPRHRFTKPSQRDDARIEVAPPVVGQHEEEGLAVVDAGELEAVRPLIRL